MGRYTKEIKPLPLTNLRDILPRYGNLEEPFYIIEQIPWETHIQLQKVSLTS